MTEFVYASHVEPWMEGKTWRNARLFTQADPSATKVFIVGDHPKIVAAYEAKDIPVNVVGHGGAAPRPREPIPAIPKKLRRRAQRPPRSS